MTALLSVSEGSRRPARGFPAGHPIHQVRREAVVRGFRRSSGQRTASSERSRYVDDIRRRARSHSARLHRTFRQIDRPYGLVGLLPEHVFWQHVVRSRISNEPAFTVKPFDWSCVIASPASVDDEASGPASTGIEPVPLQPARKGTKRRANDHALVLCRTRADANARICVLAP